MRENSQVSRRIVPWLALAGLALLAFMVVTPFLVPIAWAGILAYASWPVAMRIRRWCKNRDTLAASLTTLLAALALFIPLLWLIWLAQQELSYLYPTLQNLLANPPPLPEGLKALPWFGEWLTQQHTQLVAHPQGLSVALKTWISTNGHDLASIAGDVGKNLVKLILVIVILFFFYRDGTRIVAELRQVLARFIGVQVHDYLHAVGTTTRAVVYGVLLTAFVQGIVAGLGYWVAGLNSPVLFGVLTMVLALIPFCTPLAWGSAGLWLLLQGETGAAIGVWLWGAVVVSQLDNFLRPLFISSVSPVPFLLVLFGVLGGLLAFGLVGLFIGPIVLTVAWAVWREWTSHLDEALIKEH
ncbi:MAG TPA: AI-2E family transporter [Methylotenera sp.]|nr:AI-2E family transporter [Methylotenera sp.]HPH04605.1 AI-2E family transporter [Methylotenera sp.]